MTAIVIQARLGSTRLPGKVLMDLCGKPVLQHVIDRCLAADVANVIVATPDRKIQLHCHKHKVRCLLVPQDQDDVLLRYQRVADSFNLSRIVCADCPLIDSDHIRELVAKADPEFGYTAFWCNDSKQPAVLGHAGMPEMFDVVELSRLRRFTKSVHEHVTFGMYRTFELPSIQWIRKSGLGPLRNTIDTQDDFRRIERWLTSKSAAAS